MAARKKETTIYVLLDRDAPRPPARRWGDGLSAMERLAVALVILFGVAALGGVGYVVARRWVRGPGSEGAPVAAVRTELRLPPPASPAPFRVAPPAVGGTPADGPAGSVAGRVVDAATQAPIAGADVTAYGFDHEPRAEARGQTDADGRFSLSRVRAQPGVWLVVSAPGYAPGICEKVSVTADRPADTGTILLRRGGGRIHGWARQEGGGGLAGVEVTLTAMVATGDQTQSLAPLSALVTGADGEFVFEPLPAGRHYALTAAKRGYATATQTRLFLPPDTATAELQLRLVRTE